MAGAGNAPPVRAGSNLRSNAEDCVDELPLRYSIALGEPADLTFADCMHRLVALDGAACAFRRTEAEACRNSLLDEPVVLLDDVVQIWRPSAATAATEFTGLLEFGNCTGVRGMAIDVDD